MNEEKRSIQVTCSLFSWTKFRKINNNNQWEKEKEKEKKKKWIKLISVHFLLGIFHVHPSRVVHLSIFIGQMFDVSLIMEWTRRSKKMWKWNTEKQSKREKSNCHLNCRVSSFSKNWKLQFSHWSDELTNLHSRSKTFRLGKV